MRLSEDLFSHSLQKQNSSASSAVKAVYLIFPGRADTCAAVLNLLRAAAAVSGDEQDDSSHSCHYRFKFKNAAYLAEIFRAALNSVDEGQLEACLSVGMTKLQAYRRIILPQAVRNAIPATGNTFIGLLKETSLAFTLGVMEMFAQGKMYASGNLKYFETYLAVAIVYWVLTIIYSILQDLFERAMSKPYRT